MQRAVCESVANCRFVNKPVPVPRKPVPHSENKLHGWVRSFYFCPIPSAVGGSQYISGWIVPPFSIVPMKSLLTIHWNDLYYCNPISFSAWFILQYPPPPKPAIFVFFSLTNVSWLLDTRKDAAVKKYLHLFFVVCKGRTTSTIER